MMSSSRGAQLHLLVVQKPSRCSLWRCLNGGLGFQSSVQGSLGTILHVPSEQGSQKTLFSKDKDSVKHRTGRSEIHKSTTANMNFENSFMSVDDPGC